VAANGALCTGANSFLVGTTLCGGANPACNAGTCCRAPANCGEATGTSASFCTGTLPLVNAQASASVCSPTCTQTQCCRGPASCVEAYITNPNFCVAVGQFNFAVASTACTNCVATCCEAAVTFAPNTSPTIKTPTMAVTPTTGPPTAPPTIACPRVAFSAVISACVDKDFVPVVACSTSCKNATDALLAAFASYSSSVAKVCLDQASANHFVAGAHDYVVAQLQAKAVCCPAGSSISAVSVVSYSAPLLALLIFTALV